MASGRRSPGWHPGQAGFTLLGVLFLVALLGTGLAALGTVWETAGRREKEAQLLFVGDQYRKAIASFWRASPSGQARLPKSIGELLRDPRFPHTVRHLRRPYPDPIAGQAEWGLVKRDDGIAGIHSLSAAKPYKSAGFGKEYAAFEGAAHYADWVFVFDYPANPPQEKSPAEDRRNKSAKNPQP